MGLDPNIEEELQLGPRPRSWLNLGPCISFSMFGHKTLHRTSSLPARGGRAGGRLSFDKKICVLGCCC